MHVWKDKNGNKLTAKEFMSRWKEGIAKVSALDKAKMQLLFSWIVLIGIAIGIVSVAIMKTWWLLIILVGSFGLSTISLLSIYQQYMVYKNLEKMLNDNNLPLENNQKEVENGF